MSEIRITTQFGSIQPEIELAISEIEQDQIIDRIWQLDHRVWKPEPTEISNRLGWLHIAEEMQTEIPRLQAFAHAARTEGFTQVLLLGMGGSSLAPEVIYKTFGAAEGYLDLAILDSTDPGAVQGYADRLDLQKTLFIVATKSGGTVETLSFFKYFYNQVSAQVGQPAAGQHFIAITDPGSKLEALAQRYQFRETFLNNPDIGGRFSALSFFGLVPAALIGVDLALLLERATDMAALCTNQATIAHNPGALLGSLLGEMAKHGVDKVTFVVSAEVASFGDWVEQLIAESTGKEGKGILPVVGEPLALPETYGKDRVFVQLKLGDDQSFKPALRNIEAAGHPVMQFQLRDPYDLGSQFFLWEFATAIAGYRLGINPFDQPNVESAKVMARKMVAEFQETGVLPSGAPAPLTSESLSAFLAQAQPGDYICLQAYLNPTADHAAALRHLRLQLRDTYHLATSLGFGPRFLHSTGQLHKGDRGNGLFIQFTADPEQDLAIPDEAGKPDSTINFGTLELAQALGDGAALQAAGRRLIRFHLGTRVLEGLQVFN